ncbi:MAG: Ig-like domain-containing protein [Synergistaceae bacterium]|nr:Ig-like domain-containing protein [Synergistaceae bacterium]
MRKKFLLLLCVLSIMAAPAHADFMAIERGLTTGRIIRGVSDDGYIGGLNDDHILSESEITTIMPSSGYIRKGLVADGNTRVILRYRSDTAGTVAFSISPEIPGSKLERFTNRAEVTATTPVPTTDTTYTNQASVVFIAPETWPSTLTYPKGEFTVTATFTPSNGGSSKTESLKLTLQAPPVVLIHGAFGKNESAFGYTQGTRHGVWQKLEDAGLTVASWNYPNLASPKDLITNNNNGLGKTIAQTLDKLVDQGIAATRVDLVTHSSGGLLARQYLRNDIETGNKDRCAYGLGTVRRVVTIASPNLGSNVSSFCTGSFDKLPSSWQNWDAKDTWETLVYAALKSFVFDRKNANEVMRDTSLNSAYIAQLANLGYPEVPFHSIYGKVSKDQDKFNELVTAVVNNDIASLKKSQWLPEYVVNLLLSANLDIVSGVLQVLEPNLKIRELLHALFGNDDHDLVVSETSAKDVFPSNATTAFEGLGKYNHILIAQQDDVGEKVVSLLKGGTDSFMINKASSAAYDRAFDAFVSNYSPSRFMKADDVDWEQYIDSSLAFDVSTPQTEPMGADSEEPVVGSVRLKGTFDSALNNDVLIRIVNADGAAQFFFVPASGDTSFDVSVWADDENKGIVGISYMTVQGGKIKISTEKTVVFSPLIDNKITNLIAGETIFCHVDDETPIGLVAQTADGNFDVSASDLGITTYKVADESIVKVTGDGYIKALKEGTTTITATAQGKTATINVSVLSSGPAVDTTKDLDTGSGGSIGSSSSSGCSAGFGAMMLLSLLALVKSKR